MLHSGFLAAAQRAAVRGTVNLNGQPLRWGQITFIPTASADLPTAFGMISRGKFDVPATGGPPVGENRIEIRDLGSVESRPTIDDVQLFVKRQPQDPTPLRTNIQTGQNDLSLDLTAP